MNEAEYFTLIWSRYEFKIPKFDRLVGAAGRYTFPRILYCTDVTIPVANIQYKKLKITPSKIEVLLFLVRLSNTKPDDLMRLRFFSSYAVYFQKFKYFSQFQEVMAPVDNYQTSIFE
jgi:hypothetical protein